MADGFDFDAYFDSDNDSDSSFHGFTEADLRNGAERRLEVDSDDSDIDFDEEEDSEDDEPPHPLPVRPNAVWSENVRPVHKPGFQGPDPGPTQQLTADKYEKDFFELLFSPELYDLIVLETNRYARQKMAVTPDPRWSPITVVELKAFIGIRIYMSVVPLPQLDMYWSTDWMFGGFYVANIMTRDRFEKISQYLHCNDSEENPPRGQPGHDKLHHVRPLLSKISERCLETYHPHQETSVDEAMIAFRGRLGFRQYLPAKPTKYGIKVWMRADPRNGFANEFQVYTGKERNEVANQPLSTRVVMELTNNLRGQYYTVNVDNFFSSVSLFEKLREKGILARGTLRTNRIGFPSKIINPQSTKARLKEQGSKIVVEKEGISVTAWKDKKPVHFLSTADNPAAPDDHVHRRKKDGTRVEVNCPAVVKEYNSNMFGVDRADQIRSEYPSFRMSKKWWVYVFYFLIDVCVGNGFILMSESPNHQLRTRTGRRKPRTLLSFRKAMAKQLTGNVRVLKRKRGPDPANPLPHMPVVSEKKGRCRHCSKRGVRAESKTKCDVCDVSLCIKCFKDFHKELNM